MDYNTTHQLYPNLTFTPPGPTDHRQVLIWDAGRLGAPVNLGFPYADPRQFLPMDIPAMLQLQIDHGIRLPSLPSIAGMHTPLAELYPFENGQYPLPPQNSPYLSQGPMSNIMPGGAVGYSDSLHGRRRHRQRHSCFNDAPIFIPEQPFTESSIFRGAGGHNSQHNAPGSAHPSAPSPNSRYIVDPFSNVSYTQDPVHPSLAVGRVIINGRDITNGHDSISTSASQSHSLPVRIPEPGNTYLLAPSGQRITGFHDIHLRAPGARIVLDGVDYTARIDGTLQSAREGVDFRAAPHHRHDRPRSVLNTRVAPYLPGPRTRVVRNGRIGRDSNGRGVIFPDINLLDYFHTYQDHHTHDQYLHLLNEAHTKLPVCRPTPLHASYTFGPSILPDPFHEIAVDQKRMVVIREIEGALPADRRYPNCLCGKPMNDEEIEGGWRLCLFCHWKVGNERELVEVHGIPCLREWLPVPFPGAKSWEEYTTRRGRPSWKTEEGRERLILKRKGRVPYSEDRLEGARSEQHHARHSHGRGGKGQDTAGAGPSGEGPFEERMRLDGDITQEEIWLLAAESQNQRKKDKGKREEVDQYSIPSTPAWVREIKAEREQMETRRLEEEHIKSLDQAIRASRHEQSSNAAGPSTAQHLVPTDIAAQKQYLNKEHRLKNQAESDFKRLKEIYRQRDNQRPQPSEPDWKRAIAARCEDTNDGDEPQHDHHVEAKAMDTSTIALQRSPGCEDRRTHRSRESPSQRPLLDVQNLQRALGFRRC